MQCRPHPPLPHLPRLNRKLATKGFPCVCALSAPTICLSLVWYQVSPWPLGCVNNRWAGYPTPVRTKTREYDGIICYCGIKNGIILTKYPTLPFSPNKCSTCNQLIILFTLESFQVTAPDTGGHVTWQAEVTVTQNEQQDGTGEVRRINSWSYSVTI